MLDKDHGRNKSAIAVAEEIKKEAKNICEDFKKFTDGWRVVFLIQRHKDGGSTNNSKLKKIITKNPKEFEQAVHDLLHEFYEASVPLRIYFSVNARDMKKSIRKFRHEQLESEDYGQEQHEEFYVDIRNRFIGCMMQPGQKSESNFMWDIDTKDDSEFLKVLPPEIPIVMKYATKQGWHFVTPPFNHTQVIKPKDVTLCTDGLLLLKY